MRRVIGAVLLVIGAAVPIVCFVGLLVWISHMYTIGISIDQRAKLMLSVLALADAGCIASGFHLFRRRRISN